MCRFDHGGKIMPRGDNIYHYVAYAVVLVIFFIVLKSPKKKK